MVHLDLGACGVGGRGKVKEYREAHMVYKQDLVI